MDNIAISERGREKEREKVLAYRRSVAFRECIRNICQAQQFDLWVIGAKHSLARFSQDPRVIDSALFLKEFPLNNVDMSGFQVHAKHEEKSDTKSVYREYNREFLLPKGTNPEAIKSSLSRDGVLTVEAPLPQLAITDRNIPVQKH